VAPTHRLTTHHSAPLAPDRSERTRGRLLEAAGAVFSERGLRAATVRQICSRADANIAAVCYHFGSKEELYSAVLVEAYRAALAKYPPLLGTSESAPAEARLHAFVHSLLLRILDQDNASCFGSLILREFAEPTPALATVVEQTFRPIYQLLTSIVAEILAEAAGKRPVPPRVAHRCAASVLGQCLFYKHTKPISERLTPHLRFERGALAELADHITKFSLAGIHEEARRAAKGAAPRRAK